MKVKIFFFFPSESSKSAGDSTQCRDPQKQFHHPDKVTLSAVTSLVAKNSLAGAVEGRRYFIFKECVFCYWFCDDVCSWQPLISVCSCWTDTLEEISGRRLRPIVLIVSRAVRNARTLCVSSTSTKVLTSVCKVLVCSLQAALHCKSRCYFPNRKTFVLR